MKPGPKYTCECGETLSVSQKDQHERSDQHQHYLVWGRGLNPVSQHEKYVCECGRTMALCQKLRHEQSVWHRNYRQIQDLLKQPDVVLEEIAVRMGVSRQYIQQIAKATQRDWNGSTRRKTRTKKS